MPAVGRAPGVEEGLRVADQGIEVERAVGLQENPGPGTYEPIKAPLSLSGSG